MAAQSSSSIPSQQSIVVACVVLMAMVVCGRALRCRRLFRLAMLSVVVYWCSVVVYGVVGGCFGFSSDPTFLSATVADLRAADFRDSFRPVIEIGHYEIFGANLDSAIPATKLNWVSSYNLLMASGTHSGPSGVLGNIKFWDLRSGNAVWELKEKVDCFADVTVSDNLSAIFKVGVNSGEVFFTDLRTVGAENSWVCLGDKRKVVNGKKEGFGCKIENHGNQVFLFCSFLFDSVKFQNIQILWFSLAHERKANFDGN
ncbi:hypothetical protein F0562_005939 [Nyssa sinensis]|uniref:Uncharacterized protein n=1 Tax=Nyssa sinensis TaxID=561372 RepID=A0A5J5AP42_9ASTE|nr:hypothetical protein F0562_005939 [Nyssa sinensis]